MLSLHDALPISARCHDEEANFLALNLMHDIVTGAKTVAEARAYYGKEFLDYRRKKPTPYMERLRFTTNSRSEEHTSELQSLMRISYAVFCLKKQKNKDET